MNTDAIEELERLVSRLIDGQLSESEAARLETLLAESPEAVSRYHELLDNHEALCAIYPGDVFEASLDFTEIPRNKGAQSEKVQLPATLVFVPQSSLRRWAIAATILVAVGLAGYFLGQGTGAVRTAKPSGDTNIEETGGDEEHAIAGHAAIRRAAGIRWSKDSATYREGDVLPAGALQFDDGIVEVDFFCGATLIVEGPASMDIESDWSVKVVKGRLRANVPPAARGFVVKAAGSEIVDLGTEFALEVSSENARLEVIDGEVELRGGEHDGSHLVTGERRLLKGAAANPESLQGMTTVSDIELRRAGEQAERLAEWKKHSQQLRTDERLIAYYPIAEEQDERIVGNVATTGSMLDGKLVGPVDQSEGRFGSKSTGLDFGRPGARVRTRVDGEFEAFTFACWVRIDSLEHRYNALFMGDGYENGEPHWQIRDDGRLMFSVMVDDTQEVRFYNKTDRRVVQDAGLHRVYFTEPFWDVSKSGQWFHLAAVYDPIGRQVAQYVNGEQMSSEKIIDKFHITKLRIGPAEIGNWGQPFRKTPWFAVRNLNGTIDELAIFNAALAADEIYNLYEQGKPLTY